VPAVSGSSGKLVLCHPVRVGKRAWPGQVFAETDREYGAAMEDFVATRLADQAATRATRSETAPGADATDDKEARRARLNAVQCLQVQRREERTRRQLADREWRERRRVHQTRVAAVAAARRARQAGWQKQAGMLKGEWRGAWTERHGEYARRRTDDARRWAARSVVRPRPDTPRPPMNWIAILVIVDNCTRQCVGLPLFTLGVHVTAALVVDALRTLLPPELAYLIADAGSHFAGTALAELARAHGFVRVPLATYRPQSNGIAERFVATLKSWLARAPWDKPEELTRHLTEFLADYNDRPHQGAELAGLSPNEYANRIMVI
jgi:transposase InsO family protein